MTVTRVLVPLLLWLSGCNADCVASPNIQITLLLDGVDRSAIAQFRLGLTVGIGSTKYDTIPAPANLGPSTTLLLQPDPPPALPYPITFSVDALDGAGNVEAIGSTDGTVSPNGCNRMQLRLTPLPISDMSVLPDLTPLPDLSGQPLTDLTVSEADIEPSCSGGMPDEDGDGRADFCDVCAVDSDPTPTDGDSDGVPDACDPDPAMAGNHVLYYEPFSSDSGHWMTSAMGFQVMGGALHGIANPGGSLLSANTTDALPDGAMVETYWTSPFVVGSGPYQAGIFLGDKTIQNGALCTINYVSMTQQTLDLDTVVMGAITATRSQTLPFGNDVTYRLRLTQKGTQYTCEGIAMILADPPTATVTATITGPSAPQYLALRAVNLEIQFLNVFAVSVNP
jgi:hypothetical protein